MTQKSHPDDLDSETLLLFITLHYRRPQDKYQANQPKIVFMGMKKHTRSSNLRKVFFLSVFSLPRTLPSNKILSFACSSIYSI